jgi:hypothetical protein
MPFQTLAQVPLHACPRPHVHARAHTHTQNIGRILTLMTASMALHFTAPCCEAHTNFANESACLTADNVQNEVITIHRSQEVLKLLSLYTQIFQN